MTLPAGADAGGVRTAERVLGWLLLVGGVIGCGAAFALVVEKIALLTDAGHTPSCDLNPVLSCGSIMSTDQAELLGFPNPLIGLAAFPVVAATGAALLAGARLQRWYWLGLQLGVTLGVVFVGWLFHQSLYVIGALCPYCMVVWVVTVPLFWFVTVRNASAGVLGEGVAASAVLRAVQRWQVVVLTVVALIALGLILEQFWYYWRTLV